MTGQRAARPKDSASLIIVDRSGAEPRMLMGRRSAAHRFMPDVFVFPGGRVDAADHRAGFATSFSEAMRQQLLLKARKDRPRLPEALLAAALREAEEEAGMCFEVMTPAHRLFQCANARFVARAITPSHLPRRFDTRFFMIDRSSAALERSGASGPDKELVELAWVTFEEAQDLQIAAITLLILRAIELPLRDNRHGFPIPFVQERHGIRHITELTLLCQ